MAAAAFGLPLLHAPAARKRRKASACVAKKFRRRPARRAAFRRGEEESPLAPPWSGCHRCTTTLGDLYPTPNGAAGAFPPRLAPERAGLAFRTPPCTATPRPRQPCCRAIRLDYPKRRSSAVAFSGEVLRRFSALGACIGGARRLKRSGQSGRTARERVCHRG